MHNPSSETRLLTNSPTMSYREIWSLGGLSIRKFVIELIRKFGRLQISARSASLAYYALFSTAPLLILILAVSAMLPIEHLIETTLQAVEAGMPDNVANMVRLQLNEMEGTINLTLTLGSAFLLMRTGSRLFSTLGRGLDAAYGVEEPRNYFSARLVSLLMVFLLLLLLLVTMIALVFGPQVIRYFLQELQLDWMQSPTYPFARWGLLAGFMLVASSLLYWIVPSVKVGYYLISPGSLGGNNWYSHGHHRPGLLRRFVLPLQRNLRHAGRDSRIDDVVSSHRTLLAHGRFDQRHHSSCGCGE